MPIFRSRSTSSAIHLAGNTRVALTSNQWLWIAMLNHLVISAHVTLRSCASELADTIVVDPMRVVSIQIVSHDTNADLPIPRPEDTASRSVSKSMRPSLAWMWSRSSTSTSLCHLRGPSKCSRGVFGFFHGKANRTKASGSFFNVGFHSVAIRRCSSSGEYTVVCIYDLPFYDPLLRLL